MGATQKGTNDTVSPAPDATTVTMGRPLCEGSCSAESILSSVLFVSVKDRVNAPASCPCPQFVLLKGALLLLPECSSVPSPFRAPWGFSVTQQQR